MYRGKLPVKSNRRSAAVKDPHLRGVIAGVIMQRILDEVDTNEKVDSGRYLPHIPLFGRPGQEKRHSDAHSGFALR